MERWFRCPGCDLMVTGLVRQGCQGGPYSPTHCCQSCEQGLKTHSEKWYCAGVPAASFRSVRLRSGTVQNYLLHDPGGNSLPVLLFLHGALTFLYPETLWWDLRDLVHENQTCRDNFIVIAPFCSIAEPVVHPAEKTRLDRFYTEVQYVKRFDPEVTWDFFLSALRTLEEGQRFDPERLHVTGYSMGGQAAWNLACLYGSRLASVAPMAARCEWDDAWEEANILGELESLPIWAYAGEWDDKVICWQDFRWLAEKRDKETKVTETIATQSWVTGSIHTWSAKLSLGLVKDTEHNCWGSVLHCEDSWQLFTRMLNAKRGQQTKRTKLT